MKPAVFYATCDENNFQYAIPFWRSMTKFHDPLVIDMLLYTNEKRPERLKQLPKAVQVIDVTSYLQDPLFFYRQKPVLAEPLLAAYELAVGFDVDQIILGNLDYILKTTDYDVGTVINWNRADPPVYGSVDLGRIGIAPVEYFNCGLVALRSKQFAHLWKSLCFSPQFERVQYREQDIFNVLCYYGNYNIRCFDHGDGVAKYAAWHGLIGKGEWVRAIVRDKDIVIPKGFGDTPFPPEDMLVKVIHKGGGGAEKKDNWAAYFTPEVMERINELIK